MAHHHRALATAHRSATLRSSTPRASISCLAQPLFALGGHDARCGGKLDLLGSPRSVRRRNHGCRIGDHAYGGRVDCRRSGVRSPDETDRPVLRRGSSQDPDRRTRLDDDRGYRAEGFRRVVPSPGPLAPIEAEAIEMLIESGFVVVAAGGGGIPVVRDGDSMRGVDAVIDKDFAAERIADSSGAQVLVMVTGVFECEDQFRHPRRGNDLQSHPG